MELRTREHLTLALLLLVIATISAIGVMSCGGGGGSSNGGLCEQCGVSDGPCQDSDFFVPAGSGVRDAEPCATAASGELNDCMKVNLICRRKSDSSQQRCYPRNPNPNVSDPDFSFRCDGSRPGGTALPEPTLTLTPSPQSTPTKTPDPNQLCGDGTISGTEECESTNLAGKSCNDFCASDTGTLTCVNCQFVTSGCTGGNCSR